MAIILDGTSGEQLAGNLTFTGTGNRITGDFSNANQSNRVLFQTTTSDTATNVGVIPNGTGNEAQYTVFSSSDPTNAALGAIKIHNPLSSVCIESGKTGTGTYRPMTFLTSNTEQMRIAVDGTITGTKGNLQLISGTAVSASGTSVDFTSIPSWVKRITVMFSGVSMSSASPYMALQLGAGSVDSSGYTGSLASVINGVSGVATNFSTSFLIGSIAAAADTFAGAMVLTNISSNIWVISGVMGNSAARGQIVGGTKTLSGTLDRVRVLTSDGSSTFDAGTINIMYE